MYLIQFASLCQIELKTAPADFRFPTTNQTRHCFTRYIEYHKYGSTAENVLVHNTLV